MRIIISITGTGCTDSSLVCQLYQCNGVCAVDVLKEKSNVVNHNVSPIKNNELDLEATLDIEYVNQNADIVIVADRYESSLYNYSNKVYNMDSFRGD